ncbi:hypothetical protein [uncultured Legionella sp.]|uniref:hypothetical protein n=1 Tax=uncultured Legionella sp. TaxID=210934 RepID=UPI0026351D94|nr:hypothetical protein [uncultured Legionella sp.]
MHSPALCSLAQNKTHSSLALDLSVINPEYSVDDEGVIGLYVQSTQLSVFIETKNCIEGYTINPEKNKTGQWRNTTLSRTTIHTNEFALLRNSSGHFTETNESSINLELFKEMLNQETKVGFSNIKDINNTVQLALSLLNSSIEFQYKPE